MARMEMRAFWAWLAVSLGLATCLYAWFSSAAFFADDYQMLFLGPKVAPWRWFVTNIRANGFYRPLQAIILSSIQDGRGGVNTSILHYLQIALHAVNAVLVLWCVRRIGGGVLQAALAWGLFVVSQANVHVIISNDTVSQIMGVTFGLISFAFLLEYVFGSDGWGSAKGEDTDRQQRLRLLFGAVAGLVFSLFSKETSTAWFAVDMGLLGWVRMGRRRKRELKRALVEALPFMVVTLGYLMIRSKVATTGVNFGADRYSFHIGLNILRNIALLLGVGVIPFSSVHLFALVSYRSWGALSLIGLLSIGFLGPALWGLWKNRSRSWVIFFSFSALVTMFPVALLNHVGELYVYNSAPFIAALLGIGWGTTMACLWEVEKGRALILVGVVVIALGMNVWSDVAKARLMEENGQQASRLIQQAVALAGRLHPSQSGEKTTILVSDKIPGQLPRYSVFVMSPYQLVQYADHYVQWISHRPDIRFGRAPSDAPHPAGELMWVDGSHSVELQVGTSTSNRRPTSGWAGKP